jgi:folate-binding protein YgfZ
MNPSSSMVYEDPRIKELGQRIYSMEIIEHETDSDTYDLYRIMNGNLFKFCLKKKGIGEGVVDIPMEGSFPSEINFDQLNGISYSKGCYLGQELTARTHFTGLTRKRIFPIFSKDGSFLKTDDEIFCQEEKVGVILSTNKSVALAKIKFENLKELQTKTQNIKMVQPLWMNLKE